MRRIAAIFLQALVLVSCGGGSSVSDDNVCVPLLYRTVPSDAVALVSGEHAADVLAYYDSSSVLHSLKLGELSKSAAVLSVNFVAAQIPALSIDLGETSSASLSRQADSLGLVHDEFQLADDGGLMRNVIVVTTSEQLLKSIRRHIKENASIVDADCFDEVLKVSGRSDNIIVMRNSEASRLIPASFLSGYLSRARLIDFTKKLSKWMVFSGDSEDMDITFVTGVSGAYFSRLLDSLDAAPCKVADMLPASTQLVVDLPLKSTARFRSGYERFMDANVALDQYRDTLSALKDRCGRSPLQWEGDLKIREVALVRTDSLSVLLVRPDRKPKLEELRQNPYRQFIAALYGKAFDIDDSSVAVSGKWLVYGGREDVQRFLTSSKGDFDLPSKCKALFMTPELTIVAKENKNEMEINR